MTRQTECACPCHQPPWDYSHCCHECEPEAYDVCAACGAKRYQHNADEREGSPGACEAFVDLAVVG